MNEQIQQVSSGPSVDWHSLKIPEVLKALTVIVQPGDIDDDGSRYASCGLTDQSADLRRVKYGLNQLITLKPQNLIVRFLRQFHNILIYILLFSAAIALVLTRLVDATVIIGVIVLNAIVGFIQEGKAEKALAAIRDMLAPIARVVRNGKRAVIPASQLVPGDVVIIERGDKVPADLRLLETRRLQVQESILTGEASPTEKNTIGVRATASLAERSSMAYSGTIVTGGSGLGVVVATALNTEVGKVSEMLEKVEVPITPLLQQMNYFGYWITVAILLFGVGTFLFGALVWGDSSRELLMAVIGLIVAAVPEGLPPILTVILAIGVTNMARHHAIIRRLPAVETMGAVTTICSDKTGTLTCNELMVEDLVTAAGHYSSALDDLIHVVVDGEHAANEIVEIADHRDLEIALIAGILCNDAELRYGGSSIATYRCRTARAPELYGDPLDQALLVLSHKIGIDIALIKKTNPRTDLIPYESEHRFMATLHHDHKHGKNFLYAKGAAEHILDMCIRQQVNGEFETLNINYWRRKIDELAAKGEKVIGVAYREITTVASQSITNQNEHSKQQLNFSDVVELTMIAIFGVIDPPREEAVAAVSECHAAGIVVKMITGDHAVTAKAIAQYLGIGVKNNQVKGNEHESIGEPHVLTGNEIDAMDDAQLAETVLVVDVYARTSPEHKLRLVKSLQQGGQIVAMTGDGVNDAPALRQADIGIAMGEKGTEIAKEAADMVLTDNNFATIVHAVAEGRTVYENLKKTVLFVLPTSIAQAVAVVVAIFLNWQLPISAVQILWVNMITTVTLSLSLGFEKPLSDVMLKPPRSKNAPILSMFLGWRVTLVSLLLTVAVFALFAIARATDTDLATTRTIAVNVIVVGEIFYLLNCRRVFDSVLNREGLFASKPMWLAIIVVILLQLIFTYVPAMQHFFATAGLNVWQWLNIIGVGMVIFLLVEAEKWLLRLIGNLRS